MNEMTEHAVETTHDVFQVIEREQGRPSWKKVGIVFVDDEGNDIVMLPSSKPNTMRELRLALIDRTRRPIADGRDANRFPTHELLERSATRPVGAAFVNKDGSLSLVIDEGKREGPKLRLQMRRSHGAPRRTHRR